MRTRCEIVFGLLVFLLGAGIALADDETRLLRFPDIHGDLVVFSHAGDLWTAPAAGGTATRLTSHEGLELFPKFSPDGKWIAFTGQYDGSNQVYVVPSGGGEPRQLSYYPPTVLPERFGADHMVYGWTPDGKKVVFRSLRGHFDAFVGRLYAVGLEGGLPEVLPMPCSGFASFSPDGTKAAYNRVMRDFRTWKRYKGGMAQDVWIFDLKTFEIEKITDWEGTDNFPMWLGDKIYFNSDRGGRLNLYSYDLNTKGTQKVTDFSEYDVKFPSQGPDAIIFENGGYLYVFDPATEQSRKLDIRMPYDQPYARKEFVSPSNRVEDFNLGNEGKRAVFTARGEVFTVPAENGDIRNLTNTPGIREEDAVWSPDGKWIAYMSDRSGEEELYIRPADGTGEETQLTTGGDRDRFPPIWSPDSTKLLFGDKSLRIFYVDINEKKVVQIDEAKGGEIRDYSWSPDSLWAAYSKPTEITRFRSIYLYSLKDGSVHQVTTDYTNDTNPEFDPDGKYLFFVSARDINPQFVPFEANFYLTDLTRLYAVTLQADEPSPFAPLSDEVTVVEEKKEGEKEAEQPKAKEEKAEAKKEIRIDLEGITDRIVGFPLEPGNYGGLVAIKGSLVYFKAGDDGAGLYIYDLGKRKETKLLAPVQGYAVSPDGKKILYRSGGTYGIIDASPAGHNVGDGRLDLSGMQMLKDPRSEWANAFNETWRLYRDYFYAPNFHGVDWPKMRELYGALLPYVAHRIDLTYIISEMVSELATSHCYVGGGDQPQVENPGVGLLGAVFEPTESGYYKVAEIYAGENWHENLRSPLTEPGVGVKKGEYVLAIDGLELRTDTNPYKLLVNKDGRSVELTVNDKPSMEGARKVKARTITGERDLIYYTWVKKNREYVAEKTDGKVGYIHIPDMGTNGLTEFIKWYYAQLDKEGLIVDVRFNGGGFVSQQILERLRRVMAGMGHSRNFPPTTYPGATFVGHMVALTNLYAASDGDIFSYYWKAFDLGPIIGTRTWGGTVGYRAVHPMLDGGYAIVPEFGTYSLESEWSMENEGVEPEMVVDNLPKDEIAGKDTQLDTAIDVVLQLIEKEPIKRPEKPAAYPIR
jgi:tricorn protease